mgnify:FL=1
MKVNLLCDRSICSPVGVPVAVVYLACSELSVALMVCTHWLQSGSVGLKVDAGVFPYPHSRSLNVFGPK